MKIAGQTDIGSCRQENQDNFCARQLTGGAGWGGVGDGTGGGRGGRDAGALPVTVFRFLLPAAASGSGFQLCVSVPASGTARYETFISAIYF